VWKAVPGIVALVTPALLLSKEFVQITAQIQIESMR
jgi:hypothetical protein